MAIAESSTADNDLPAGEASEQEAPPPIVERKRTRLRRFAFRVLMVFAPVHLYVGWRLLPDLPVDLPLQVAGGVLLAVSALLIPFGTLSRLFLSEQGLVDKLVWAGAFTMGLFSSVLVLTLFRDIAMIFPDVRAWSAETALGVLGVSLLVTLIGFVNARRVARVVDVEIPIAGLPSALEGFTIAQITDIHVGSTIKGDYVKGIVERVNAIDADAIAITGDVVDGKVAELNADTAPLADLKARYGTFLVSGNHEYYSGWDEWLAEFRRLALKPLPNSHEVISHNGAEIVIAGVNDYSAGRFDEAQASDPAKALDGSPEDAPKILLAHQPRSADAADEAGFDLQLSGHTHGGQFWPWNHFVRMQQPYTAGLDRHGKLWVYTSRGTGYWGPPKRFGAPSEITRIRLTKA